jgi:RimJ/RimL family protein N-acetyltransferase
MRQAPHDHLVHAGWGGPATLSGHGLVMRPLQADDHDALAAWACDPLLWAQHPMPERATAEGFRTFFDDRLSQGGAWVAEDASGHLVASSSFYNPDDPRREVTVGYTFIDRRHWGGPVNPAMKLLMFDHAFLRCDRVLLTVGEHNVRSQRAVAALGAQVVGELLNAHRGRDLRSLVYAMTRQDWTGGCREAVHQRLLQRRDMASAPGLPVA